MTRATQEYDLMQNTRIRQQLWILFGAVVVPLVACEASARSTPPTAPFGGRETSAGDPLEVRHSKGKTENLAIAKPKMPNRGCGGSGPSEERVADCSNGDESGVAPEQSVVAEGRGQPRFSVGSVGNSETQATHYGKSHNEVLAGYGRIGEMLEKISAFPVVAYGGENMGAKIENVNVAENRFALADTGVSSDYDYFSRARNQIDSASLPDSNPTTQKAGSSIGKPTNGRAAVATGIVTGVVVAGAILAAAPVSPIIAVTLAATAVVAGGIFLLRR